jgi:hypothetical protein
VLDQLSICQEALFVFDNSPSKGVPNKRIPLGDLGKREVFSLIPLAFPNAPAIIANSAVSRLRRGVKIALFGICSPKAVPLHSLACLETGVFIPDLLEVRVDFDGMVCHGQSPVLCS